MNRETRPIRGGNVGVDPLMTTNGKSLEHDSPWDKDQALLSVSVTMIEAEKRGLKLTLAEFCCWLS